jgi:hypothetical protein
MALTSVVVNAFYFNKKLTVAIVPLCSGYVGEKIFEQGISQMAHLGTSKWPPLVQEVQQFTT